MGFYQGKAIRAETPRVPASRLRRIFRVLAAVAIVMILAHLPWGAMRRRVAVLTEVEVQGLHYLEEAQVAKIAGISRGQDLLSISCERSRQALLLNPRIASAEVQRVGVRGVRLRITERVPVLLVRHGMPWELDSTGVLLSPLKEGAVADVPLLTGPSFENLAEGSRVWTPEVQRGIAWMRALSSSELQLSGQVSEVDVSDGDDTVLLLMEGTRVLTSAWPPNTRDLSALRVVLADLKQRGTIAREVDLRFEHQVIVRPLESPIAVQSTDMQKHSS